MAKAPFDRDWNLDMSHTDTRTEDRLYYSPRTSGLLESTDGHYIMRKGCLVKWGSYEQAFPNVRYADFDQLGEITFSDSTAARQYINGLIGGHLQVVRN